MSLCVAVEPNIADADWLLYEDDKSVDPTDLGIGRPDSVLWIDLNRNLRTRAMMGGTATVKNIEMYELSNDTQKDAADVALYFRALTRADTRRFQYKVNRYQTTVSDRILRLLHPTLVELSNLPDRVNKSELFENDITPSSYDVSRSFIIFLASLVIRHGQDWHIPHLSSEDEGDVEFEWWHDNKAVYISVTEEEVSLLVVWGHRIYQDMKEVADPSSSDLLESWQWLYNSQ